MPPDLAHAAGASRAVRDGARPLIRASRAIAALAVVLVGGGTAIASAHEAGDPAPAITTPVKVDLPAPSAGAGTTAVAKPPALDEVVPEAPKAFDGVRVTEHLGAQVPLDAPFRDHTGAAVTLRDLVRGDLPVILTFNYSDCPMLCSLQLNGLVAALPELTLMAGRQFRIVTVVLEPLEKPARAAETRQKYLDRLPPTMKAAAAAGGWTFLVSADEGKDASIRRLADAVGFGYKFVPERNEWAHPAALIFLSPSGKVTRYVGDVHYAAELLTQSLMSAGTSEPSASAGFIMSCFHYDADVNNYSRFGVAALRYAAAGFLLLMLTAYGIWRLLRRPPPALPGVDRS